jgi:putative membrane protein
MMNGWYGNGWGGGGLFVMALMFLLFWGGVVALIIYALRRGHVRNDVDRYRSTHHEAERILAERLARGEIDEEEFNKRRAALRRTD